MSFRTTITRFCGIWMVTFVLFMTGVVSPVFSEEETWDTIVSKAQGQTVDWFMWGGSTSVNSYVNGYVASQVKELYGITLRQVPVTDIAEVVSKLVVEKQAGKNEGGEADLLWINGENFRTCKRNGLLFGPFADKLPNQKLVNWDRPSVRNDFGEPVEGLESPYGSAQVVMAYDTARMPTPPATMGALLTWVREHPGKFTYPAPPDFTGSVFVRHVFYHAAGGVESWQGDFDEKRFEEAAAKTYQILRELAPFLWREGQTYPESPIRLAQLFADGEVDFAISYNPSDASKKIHDGLYPETVRTFVFEEGTIANTHFVAIPFNASEKEGAMVVANFLLSPEAQFKKADPTVWGDLPAIDPTRLDDTWREKFAKQARGIATLSDEVLQKNQLPEPPSEILIRLEEGWDRHVLKGQ